MWQQLHDVKPITCEPRSGKEDFERIMGEYYERIRMRRGGIFLAVCRGKVLFDLLKYLKPDRSLP